MQPSQIIKNGFSATMVPAVACHICVCFGHCVQWLDVKSQFPDQELSLGLSSESAKSSPLGHQGTLSFTLVRLYCDFRMLL